MQTKLTKKVLMGLGLTGLLASLAGQAQASGFQLFEQNGAGVGDFHAGGAAEADDASTGYYNPAGLLRLDHQQFVTGVVFIPIDAKYDGTVSVNSLGGIPVETEAQGGTFNAIPFFHYSSPITKDLAFGLGVTIPFGLKTNYDTSNPIRYAATENSVKVINIGPSLGYQLTRKFSIGAGFDAQYIKGQFNQMAGFGVSSLDTLSDNEGDDWGYGYNVGALYQFSPSTRVGVAYRSQVVHHLKGHSEFKGPLAATISTPMNDDLEADVTLPPTFTFSAYHDINSRWAVLGTFNFTRWNSFDDLILKNVAAPGSVSSDGSTPSRINVVIHQNFRNTYNVALGVHYRPSDKWMVRGGIGYDESPTNNDDRNVILPDSDRYIIALGTHYQALKTLGLDFGWTHLFMKKADIDVTQTVGATKVTTDGHVDSVVDVIGLQLTWDII